MIHDFIHMTQGELLIKYWWLWSSIIILAAIIIAWTRKRP